MNILQYGFMLYLSLILLAGMGKAADDINIDKKIIPQSQPKKNCMDLCCFRGWKKHPKTLIIINKEDYLTNLSKTLIIINKEDYLTNLSKNITKIILRYLETDTKFKYFFLNQKCQKLRATIITDIAFQQYSKYLTTPNHMLKNWDQLHQFVHNPLDLTITFPILPLLSFHNLPPPPKVTEKDLVTFFRDTKGFATKYVTENEVQSYAPKDLAYITTTLPVLYDPNQNILFYLYRIGENEVVYSQHIQFPAMIILTHPNKEPRMEWLSTWSVIKMYVNAKDNSCESIACQTKQSTQSEIMLMLNFTTEGIVKHMRIISRTSCGKYEIYKFLSKDGNKGNTFTNTDGDSDYYTEIQVLYALSAVKM